MNNLNLHDIIIRRAMAARHEDTWMSTLPERVEWMIETLYNGRKYIRPIRMAIIMECDVTELCNAMSDHKCNLPTEMLLMGNYGNCNYTCHYNDKVYLQGWINFLSLPCFNDQSYAAPVVKVLKDVMNRGV